MNLTKSIALGFGLLGVVVGTGACSAVSGDDLFPNGTGGDGNLGTGGGVNLGTGGGVNLGTGGGGNLGSGGGTLGSSGGGGNLGSGGGTLGSSGGGGNTDPGNDPAGFWRYDDMKGCAWTGIDDTGSGTTVTPQDFKARAPEDPYCAQGTVGANEDYESVALLGFNINEDPATADCSYDPAAATSEGPPGIELTGSGIAANIVKQGDETDFTFRVQIQGPNGATDENDRWCATITETQGKIFVPYEDFNTKCWDDSGDAYSGQPISAVVFLVPGEPTATPYNFCVNGFAPGDSADDAPDGPAEIGDQKGTVGFTEVSPDGDFDRSKVVVGGEQYIIQNNNWGNPSGTNLILDYLNNSFKIVEGNGSGPGGGVPASFPSIYIGANGNTAGGVLATSGTDNLPKRVDEIGSIATSFKWSGSTGSFNATYDVWFANSPPTMEYKDGIDGFIMVWAHDPADAQPIGSDQGDFTIDGKTFDVWVGPRGEGPAGFNDAPVVSFVSRGDISSWSFDLKAFITEARKAPYNMNAAYLTDVFFGFEIWNGGAGGNLSVDEFTCKVE